MSNLFSSGGAGNVGASGITQQSLKFNDDESQYLSWTPASAGNRKTWTWSGWVKRGNLGTTQNFFAAATGTSDPTHTTFRFNGGSNILFAGWSGVYFGSNATFRDVSAWYHIVAVLDTTNATASDRIKVYVNGERLTGSNPVSIGSSVDLAINNTQEHSIGRSNYNNGSSYLDGYLSDIHFIDGQALDASSFGETVNGYWKAKDYAGTYGQNGFRLTFQDDVVSEGFNTVTYRGTGASQSISGLGFSPDLVWTKARGGASSHNLSDSIRGGGVGLTSNGTNAEYALSPANTFDSDGFTLNKTTSQFNSSGDTFVGWCWDAGSGSAASNTDGTITSTVKANPSYGFSIASYVGNGSSSQTVGHGLGVAPDLLIMKNRDDAENWQVNHSSITDGIFNLNTTDAKKDHTAFSTGAIDPAGNTSTVFSMYDGSANTNYPNESGKDYIVYCFAEVANYSSIGTYSGTDSAGVTVTTGFRPAFVMIKATNIAENWVIIDNTRNPANPANSYLNPNTSSAEGSSSTFDIDFTDTGFVLQGTDDAINGYSGGTGEYIYMAFKDTREAAFWKDVSGQGNNWTPNNLDYRDSLPDSPANNFATLNPLGFKPSNTTISDGNLQVVTNTSSAFGSTATIAVDTGKWYWESIFAGGNYMVVGIDSAETPTSSDTYLGNTATSYSYYNANGQKINNATGTAYGATFGTNDIIGIALDLDVGTLTFYKNGVSQGTAFSGLSGLFTPAFSDVDLSSGGCNIVANFGQDSTFAGATTAGGNQDDNGIGDFKYAPPAGYLALCTANLPTPTIIDGSEYFNTVLYTGDNADRNIDAGFKSDFVWIKQRSSPVSHHRLYDSVRGDGQTLFSSLTNAEADGVDDGVEFAYADGFNIDAGANVEYYNGSGRTYASWNWKAGGTAVSNTDGSITSQVSANTTAGFSIVSYVGNSTSGATVGHSLGVKPDMVIAKNRDDSANWLVWHKDLSGEDYYLHLETTGSQAQNSAFWSAFSPTTFTLGNSNHINGSGDDMIAYCFANTDAYLKAGSYTGNGSSDGPFVYTGFEVSWVMIKSSAGTSQSWEIRDNKREPFNDASRNVLFADTSGAETVDAFPIDFTSNGFKVRNSGTGTNSSGATYIYLAFAESPFKYATAR